MSFKKTYTPHSDAATVFAALTEPARLTIWFAEHADVEPRVGGRYRFWGRHTLWAGAERDADQVLTVFEPDRALAYRWTWNGFPTQVSMELTPADGQVEIGLTQSFDPGFEYERKDCLVDSYWDVLAENLAHYLRTGRASLLPDFAAQERDIHMSIEIDAPPEKVFQALTDPEQLDRWMSTAAAIEPDTGGAYSYGWESGEGPTRIVELIPNRLLVHDWTHPGEHLTQVRWELVPVGKGTRVELTHSAFESEHQNLSHRLGWNALLFSLSSLVRG